jgi:hypothetical protein
MSIRREGETIQPCGLPSARCHPGILSGERHYRGHGRRRDVVAAALATGRVQGPPARLSVGVEGQPCIAAAIQILEESLASVRRLAGLRWSATVNSPQLWIGCSMQPHDKTSSLGFLLREELTDAMTETVVDVVYLLVPITRLHLLAFMHLVGNPETIRADLAFEPSGSFRLVLAQVPFPKEMGPIRTRISAVPVSRGSRAQPEASPW